MECFLIQPYKQLPLVDLVLIRQWCRIMLQFDVALCFQNLPNMSAVSSVQVIHLTELQRWGASVGNAILSREVVSDWHTPVLSNSTSLLWEIQPSWTVHTIVACKQSLLPLGREGGPRGRGSARRVSTVVFSSIKHISPYACVALFLCCPLRLSSVVLLSHHAPVLR